MNVKRGVLSTGVVVLLAVAAASGVFLFMNTVRDRADEGRVTVDVLVATQDIPAGQELDPLIENGVFRTKPVDGADLLPGVITDEYQLRGQRTAYPILADEQIAGALQQGDHVEVFGSFSTRGTGSQTTHVVIDDALVLAVTSPEQDATSPATASVTATLAVTPEQASLLIFTQEQGHVWLTLLPPNQSGVEVPPASLKALR